jgi:integrase/recombinase XerD
LRVSKAVRLYIAYKRSMGWQFTEIEQFLFGFSRHVDDAQLADVTTKQVSSFLAGRAPKSAYLRHDRLRRFFSHWKFRSQLDLLPLPPPIPHGPCTFVPHIYSRAEIRRLVNEDALKSTIGPRVIDPMTMRTFLLFLYGTGVMLGEALTIKECDLDLTRDVVTVRRNARNSPRTIPIGFDVHRLLAKYLRSPIRKKFSGGNLFLTRNGTNLFSPTVNSLFQIIRRNANVVRFDGGRFQPRLHDFRSTFAVHRIAAWYDKGIDAQNLLPALGAYLGQFGLVSMNRHLSLTPEHYRKHLPAGTKHRIARKGGEGTSPLVKELLRHIGT